MKYNIQTGTHSGQVEIVPDGKGGFTGNITHTDYGDGTITNGVQTGQSLNGQAVLDGHDVKFNATLSVNGISGTISTHIFFIGNVSAEFTGTSVA